MEQITKLSVNSLKVHPRNKEFFDDIGGEMYEQFKKSIQEDGVITPIIVSPDMVVVSGNQRLLACIDLGIELIPAIIREELINENMKTRQLIAANFGRLSNNPSKMRKAIAEYVVLVGNRNGGDRKSEDALRTLISQEDIAKELGISTTTLKELLRIEKSLIPELKSALDKGFISKTAALGICGKLEESDQQDLLTELTKLIANKSELNSDKDKVSVPNLEVEKLTSIIKELSEQNKKLVETNTELMMVKGEKQSLQLEVQLLKEDLKKQPDKPETIAKIKRLEDREVILKEKIELIEKDADKYQELKTQIETLSLQKDDIGRQIKSATSLSGYIVDIEDFLKNKLAPIKYSRALLEMKENPTVIKNITDIVECVELWCGEIRKYLPKENNYTIIESEDK